MVAPPQLSEPYQTPEFEEYTYVIKAKQFIIENETIVLEAGQSIKIKNTRVQHSNHLTRNVNILLYAHLPLTSQKFIEKNS
jgi:hypothetical protein